MNLPKIAMASFDPMNLLQVFAPRYNTPSMTYQGGIGLVDMEHLFKIFQNYSNIIQHKNLSFHDLWLKNLSKICKNGEFWHPPKGVW